MFINLGPFQYDLLQKIYQLPKKMLAPQTLLCEGIWKGYTFKKHLVANIIFGLLQGDCCNCYPGRGNLSLIFFQRFNQPFTIWIIN